MGKIIVPTGYMGSGSSAITDIIREFDGYNAAQGSFEYIFLHCPDGVFDLEDKLLLNNNAFRSDEAIHSFRRRMEELYTDKIWWPANYKKRLHQEFMNYTEKYIQDLIQYESNNAWYMQQKPTFIMLIKNIIRRFLLMISAGKLRLPYALRYSPMTVSFVTGEEFYSASQKYIYGLFEVMGMSKQNLILDQLLLPYNLWRVENYFKDDIECFVVERDPRDVFISNKYFWGKKDEQVPYPTEVEEFCKYYRCIRNLEKKVEKPYIHRFWFEDLIYNYNDSIERICNILQVSSINNAEFGKYFQPENSINNTQLFLNNRFKHEAEIIEERLHEYLYVFPYERKPILNNVF